MGIQVIDLSQEIYQGMPVFPPHQKTMIFPNMSHEESRRKLGFEFATNNLLINEHGPTHSDAIYEYDPQGLQLMRCRWSIFTARLSASIFRISLRMPILHVVIWSRR